MGKINLLFDKVRTAFYHYAGALLSSIVLAISIINLIEYSVDEPLWLLKLAFTSALGISVFFTVSFLTQRKGNKWLFNLAGFAFLLFYYFIILPGDKQSFNDSYIFVIFPIFILSHLLVTVAPYLRFDSSVNFWHYNKSLFINLFLTAVFTQFLSSGILLAILGVEHLFELPVSSNLYAQTFFGLAIISSVLIFSLFSDKGLKELEEPKDYPQILQFFTQFILIPLLIIYAVILYGYSFKILLFWDLPRGWVSYLVLIYAVLGILAYLFVQPLSATHKAKSWVSFFKNIFFFSLFPLLILLFTAIGYRIAEYGLTEPRYFVILLALWLTGITLYFSFFKSAKLQTIPLSLFIVGVLALSFPFLNVFDMSIQSQKKEFKRILELSQVLKNDKIDFDASISYENAYELNNKARYLKERGELSFISAYMSEEEMKSFNDSSTPFMDAFSNIQEDSTFRNSHYINFAAKNLSFDVREFEHMFIYQYEQNSDFTWEANTLTISTEVEDEDESSTKRSIMMSFEGEKLNITEKLDELTQKYHFKSGSDLDETLMIPFELKSVKGVLLFPSLGLLIEESGKSYSFQTMMIFINQK